jgi:hypothetical protein
LTSTTQSENEANSRSASAVVRSAERSQAPLKTAIPLAKSIAARIEPRRRLPFANAKPIPESEERTKPIVPMRASAFSKGRSSTPYSMATDSGAGSGLRRNVTLRQI